MRTRFTRKSRVGRYGGLFGALCAVAIVVASLPAVAAATPKGEFAIFADCPVANPQVAACIVANTESGEFTVGKKVVPLVNKTTLQGGLAPREDGSLAFVAAKDGNTLSKTAQKVPGGLAGLVKCNEITNVIERLACEAVFENGLTGVNATVELAAPASAIELNEEALLGQQGTALSLPVKVKLDNPLFGSACYLGSNSSPIVIKLTTGTTSPPPPNKPIKGKAGQIETNEEGNIATIKNNSLVNNSFAAPGVNGCGGLFAFVLDPILNSQLGVPAAAGHNTAILNGTLKQAGSEQVIEHE